MKAHNKTTKQTGMVRNQVFCRYRVKHNLQIVAFVTRHLAKNLSTRWYEPLLNNNINWFRLLCVGATHLFSYVVLSNQRKCRTDCLVDRANAAVDFPITSAEAPDHSDTLVSPSVAVNWSEEAGGRDTGNNQNTHIDYLYLKAPFVQHSVIVHTSATSVSFKFRNENIFSRKRQWEPRLAINTGYTRMKALLFWEIASKFGFRINTVCAGISTHPSTSSGSQGHAVSGYWPHVLQT